MSFSLPLLGELEGALKRCDSEREGNRSAIEYDAVGGSRTCLSEASPADQYEELQSVLTEACNMVSLGYFSLPKQREEHKKTIAA